MSFRRTEACHSASGTDACLSVGKSSVASGEMQMGKSKAASVTNLSELSIECYV